MFYKYPELFEEIYDKHKKIDDQVLNELILASLNNRIFITLIFLDFTYINKKFNSYEHGSVLKNKVLSIIEYEKRNGSVVYYSQTASKIFVFTYSPIDIEFKKKIDACQKWFEAEYNVDNKKLIYIIDSKNHGNDYFAVGPYVEDFKQLLGIAIRKEIVLKKLRSNVQRYFKNIDRAVLEFGDNSDLDDSIHVLDKYHQKMMSDLRSEFNSIKYDLSDVGLEDRQTDFFKTLKSTVSSSEYLQQAIHLWEKTYEFNNPKYLEEAKSYVVKYLIWEEMQELQLIGYKVEKVYSFFNRSSAKSRDTKNNVVQFKDSVDLMNWYDSTVSNFIPMLNESERMKAMVLKEKIMKYDGTNFKQAKEIRDIVHDLFDNLEVKGIFNLPLEKFTPSLDALEFFKYQLYHNYGSAYKSILEAWISNVTIKKNYYIVVSEPSRMYTGIRIMNGNLLKDQDADIRIHTAFLEIDGFNPFNTYFFPSDTDHIVYQRIINSIFEVAHKYMLNDAVSQELFSSLVFSFLGDEFFMSFLTKGQLDQNKKKLIVDFLHDVSDTIVSITKDIVFANTEKIDIDVIGKGNISFRKTISKNLLSTVKFEIGRLSVSGIFQYDISYKSIDYNYNNEVSRLNVIDNNVGENFKNYINVLESAMSQTIKKKSSTQTNKAYKGRIHGLSPSGSFIEDI